MEHRLSIISTPAAHVPNVASLRLMQGGSLELRENTSLLWHGANGGACCLADTYIKNDVLSIEESIVNHVEYTMARSRYKFDDQEAYMATAYSLRDRLIESWNDTQAYFKCEPAVTLQQKTMPYSPSRTLALIRVANDYTVLHCGCLALALNRSLRCPVTSSAGSRT